MVYFKGMGGRFTFSTWLPVAEKPSSVPLTRHSKNPKISSVVRSVDPYVS